jgi:hypothetical protein
MDFNIKSTRIELPTVLTLLFTGGNDIFLSVPAGYKVLIIMLLCIPRLLYNPDPNVIGMT